MRHSPYYREGELWARFISASSRSGRETSSRRAFAKGIMQRSTSSTRAAASSFAAREAPDSFF
jgi:hypothetical protein